MYQRLREMSALTGPAAARLMGDVSGRVQEVASNYDTQSIKLFQMAAAVGGFRFREGREGWRERTEQRQKFGPFDLNSYARGQLNMSIAPRPLVPFTEADTVEMQGKRLQNAKVAEAVYGVPDKVLEIAGESDKVERAKLIAARDSGTDSGGLEGIMGRIVAGAVENGGGANA
jgi:hypothetical protein